MTDEPAHEDTPDTPTGEDGVPTIRVPQDLEDRPRSLQEAIDEGRGGGAPYPTLGDSAGIEDGVAGTGGVNKSQDREF